MFSNSRANRQFYFEERNSEEDFPHHPRVPQMSEIQLEEFCYRTYRMIVNQQREIRNLQRANRRMDELDCDLRMSYNENDRLKQQLASVQQELAVVRSERNTISASFKNKSQAVDRAVSAAQEKAHYQKNICETLEREILELKSRLEESKSLSVTKVDLDKTDSDKK